MHRNTSLRTVRARELRRFAPDAERLLWGALRARRLDGCKFVRQEPIGSYFADFACREHKLVIEVDGATHSALEETERDRRRDAQLRQFGYRVLRFNNQDVYENLQSVLETIATELAVPSPLRGEG